MRTRHGIAWLSFLCASILLPGAAWPMDASCASAPQQLEDWETASPEDVGFDAAVLCKITQELAAQGGTAARPDRKNVHAVLVVRHGKLVFEAYAAGRDENWGEPLGVVPHDAATKHDVRSISKSVVSLLFGIALERKLIAGTGVPVMSFFPEYAELKTPKWDKILLRHLLSMTPGYVTAGPRGPALLEDIWLIFSRELGPRSQLEARRRIPSGRGRRGWGLALPGL